MNDGQPQPRTGGLTDPLARRGKTRLPPERARDRYVFTTIACCPRCRGRSLRRYRTTRHPDQIERHGECSTCHHRFIEVAQYAGGGEDNSEMDSKLRNRRRWPR
jgi:hypothetical protein